MEFDNGVFNGDSRITLSDDSLLTPGQSGILIKNVQLNDAGTKYICSAENKHENDTSSAFLDVKKNFEVLKDPEDIQFESGKDATFTCSVKVSCACVWLKGWG